MTTRASKEAKAVQETSEARTDREGALEGRKTWPIGRTAASAPTRDEKSALDRMLKARLAKLKEKQDAVEDLSQQIEKINGEIEIITHLLEAEEIS